METAFADSALELGEDLEKSTVALQLLHSSVLELGLEIELAASVLLFHAC